MARKDSTGDLAKVLGSLEAEVMQVMWAERRPLDVRTVLERLNNGRSPVLAYTTVMTVMSRLAEKGILNRQLDGRGYVYEAAVADAAAIAVRNVMRDFGDAAMAQFVDEARADPKLRRRLERLLRDER
jgi:predicted transcriptional regulator